MLKKKGLQTMACYECIAIYSASFLVSYIQVILIFLFQKAMV